LIIDRERQAAIDAAYGMGNSASTGGGSGTDSGCAVLEQVLEAYDLPSGMALASVQQALEVRRENNVLRVAPGVDAASALVVFSSERSARDALDKHQQQLPQRQWQGSGEAAEQDGDVGGGVSFKLRSMATASRETHLTASNLALPPAQRKATDSRAATRMLAGALGLRLPRQSPEAREEEKRAREERRRKLDEKRAAAAAAAAAATTEANHADAWED
jgi:hypothetical protein